MMRLLLITNRYPAGPDDPASPFVPHFVDALVEAGISVDVLTPDYGFREQANGVIQIHRFPTGATVPIGSWNYLSPFSWLRLERFVSNGVAAGRDLCASNHYDHILALWALPSGHFAQRLSAEFGIPYSVWCLGSDIYAWAERPIFRTRIERVLRGAQCVFADGNDLCRRINNWLGIDAQFMPSFRPLHGVDDAAPPQTTSAPKYLYLGRLHRAKGVYELLEAFRIVREKSPNASLTFVGGGPALKELTARVAAADIAKHVRLLGPVGNAEIIEQLRACDCVVIPSRSDSIPLVLTEAVQANRPVIGTNVGDLGAMIREYGLGAVTESIEPWTLAQTMLAVAESPSIDSEGRRHLLDCMRPGRAVETFLNALTPQGQQDSSTENSPTSLRKAAYSE
ncbi:MAG: hypothetical protein Kow0074_18790 [Candidatus Zixiibacteriota bacterium]